MALSLLWAACPVAAQTPAGQAPVGQIEEEDLDAPPAATLDRGPAGASAVDRDVLRALHDEARATYESEQRPASLPLFGRVLDLVTSIETRGIEAPGLEAPQLEATLAVDGGETSALGPELRALRRQALLYRAALHLELGADDLAREDLRLLLEDTPSARSLAAAADPPTAETVATAPLTQLFDTVRDDLIGTVRFVLDPPDAQILVDDRPVDDPSLVDARSVSAEASAGADPEQPPGEITVDLLAGERRLTITRPGHEPVSRLLTVEAGRRLTLEQTLERTSPVLRVATRPTGASVYLDGILLGATEGVVDRSFQGDGTSAASGTVFRLDELSRPLVVDGIEPGLRVLEVRAAGHRPYRAELEILEPIDYQMPPIVLEAESGQLVFQSFPAGAAIRVDGEVVQPDVPGATRPRVTLAPGDYLVTVDDGAARMDSTRLRLADGQTVEIDVALRPGVAFLGTLDDARPAGSASEGDTRGTSPAGADRTGQTLRQIFADSPHWTLIDRAAEGVGLLRELGVGAETMRRLARGVVDPSVDWRAVQAALDRRAPGLAYLIAIPSNDLLEPEPALWVWAAAPGPARPERLGVSGGGSADARTASARDRAERLRVLFDEDLPLRRPAVGALVIDSDAVPHPVVASVAPASPAERAGFQVGMQVLGVAGTPVQTAEDFVARILAAETGETVEVALRGGVRPQAVSLKLGSSPWAVLGSAIDRPQALAWARLVPLAERAAPDEAFVVALDRALILLRANDPEGAVRELRAARAPQISHGFGQATLDYWLGVALSRVGPEYLGAAREALERAARVPGARMFHHDDAWVAPRAEARLRALDAGIF